MKRILSLVLFCLAINVSFSIAQCSANFSYSTNNLTAQFNDSSFISPNFVTTYFWDFGDGNFSTLQNPTHTYAQAGTYFTCLTIQDTTFACFDSICYNVTIVAPPPCSASYSYTVNNNNSVNFFGNVSGGVAPYLYSWDFGLGPGSGSSLLSPTVFFPSSGSYGVNFTVTDANGVSCSFYDTVHVNTCSASFSYQFLGNGILGFTNTSIPQNAGSSFSWNFGDGTMSNALNPTHTYNSIGNFAVDLFLFDSLTNCSSQFTDSIFINATSNCQAGFSFTTNNDTLFLQNLANNFDSIVYDFGDGNLLNQNNNSVTHQYAQSGTYVVCQTVFNTINNCTDSFCDTVSINIQPPCQAGFSFSTNIDTLFLQSMASNADSIVYDFGDGTLLNQNNASITHQYAQSGTYVVCQTVFNTLTNCTDSFCDTVSINIPPPCQAGFTFSVNDNMVSILNRASNYTSLIYDFGDGTVLGSANPMYTYAQSGTYVICQTVFNTNTGCQDSFCDTVIIVVPPPCQAGFSFTSSVDTVNFQSTAQNFTSITYDFGDGNFSSQINPSHVFDSSGTYVVCQTVSNLNCTSTFCDTILIRIPPPCRADFDYSVVGDSVYFTSSASSFNRVMYYFGDGDSSSATNPIHDYQSSGTYRVTQVVYNDTINCIDSISKTVTISVSFSCVAEYQIALDTNLIGKLFLVNTSSNDNTHSYLWDFGDGTTSTDRLPRHRFSENIAYKICLTVSDLTLGCTSTYCDSVGLDTNGNILKSKGFDLLVIDGSFIGLEEVNIFESASIYPNPFSNTITIELSEQQMTNYQVVQSNSQLIQEGQFNEKQHQLPLEGLKSGVYFLRLFNQENSVVKKVIKR